VPDKPNLSPWRWRTNSHGHIADGEYPVEKPENEFRIITIGDSFTAGVTNSVRWPALLEECLSRDPEWTKLVGKRTRVINLGLHGMGVVQFKEVFEREAIRFAPDLVLVSLILDDLRRKLFYQGKPREDNQTDAAIRAFVREKILRPLPWFGFYPEFLAVTKLGQRLGMRSRLEPQLIRHYPSIDASMAASLHSLRCIVSQHPHVLILHHPTYEELAGELDASFCTMKQRLYQHQAELHLLSMIDYMPDSKREGIPLSRWYQIPHDRHPTDEGLAVYAQALERALVSEASAHSWSCR
jgi:hypothetical protein